MQTHSDSILKLLKEVLDTAYSSLNSCYGEFSTGIPEEDAWFAQDVAKLIRVYDAFSLPYPGMYIAEQMEEDTS